MSLNVFRKLSAATSAALAAVALTVTSAPVASAYTNFANQLVEIESNYYSNVLVYNYNTEEMYTSPVSFGLTLISTPNTPNTFEGVFLYSYEASGFTEVQITFRSNLY